MSDRDSSNSFLWFLAGLGFGALMGVLYAPRSGRETRDAIKNTAQEGGEYLKTRGREAKETVSQWVDRGKDVVAAATLTSEPSGITPFAPSCNFPSRIVVGPV